MVATQKANIRSPVQVENDGKEPQRITRRLVQTAAAGDRTRIIYDADLAGFGLRITTSGVKAYIVEYRPGARGRATAKRRVTIGRVSDALTPEKARKAATDMLARIRLGDDPVEKQLAERSAITVAAAIEAFEREHLVLRKRSTARGYGVIFGKHVIPAFGTKRLKDITEADVAKLRLKIGRKAPVVANRVLGALSSVFTFAGRQGLVPKSYNPVRGLPRYPEHARERYLTNAELACLGETLRLAETAGLPFTFDETTPEHRAKHRPKPASANVVFSPHTTAALRLLLFTGARLGEILGARWADVDFGRALLRLRDSKTGPKWLTLNAPALAVLSALPRDGQYIIAGEKKNQPRSDLKRPWDRIRAHAGLGNLRIHDLRHSFASVGASGGLGLPIVGKLLGHSTPATTARYAHLDADPLRKASNRIAGEIAAAMGEAPAESAEIVDISERARR